MISFQNIYFYRNIQLKSNLVFYNGFEDLMKKYFIKQSIHIFTGNTWKCNRIARNHGPEPEIFIHLC